MVQKLGFQSKIFIIATIIVLVVGGVFLSLASINWTLVVGWMTGAFIALVGQLITVFFIEYLFKKQRSKSLARTLGYAKVFIMLLFHSLGFLGVVFINKYVSGVHFLDKGVEHMYSPINIFTYIGGISLITISTFVAYFFDN